MAITITITDPDTIALLRSYRRFIGEVDQVSGPVTLSDAAEGLVIGCLDEHQRFRAWQQRNKEVRAA